MTLVGHRVQFVKYQHRGPGKYLAPLVSFASVSPCGCRAHSCPPFPSYTMAFHIFPQYTHRSFATQQLQVMRGPSSQSLYRSSLSPIVKRPSTMNCCSCSSPQAQRQPSQTLRHYSCASPSHPAFPTYQLSLRVLRAMLPDRAPAVRPALRCSRRRLLHHAAT